MDSKAKEHFQRRQSEKAGQEQANQMSIAGEPWQFTIQGVKISWEPLCDAPVPSSFSACGSRSFMAAFSCDLARFVVRRGQQI